MALAPACAAASTSSRARSTDPPWFRPISAITNTGASVPIRRPPISRSMSHPPIEERRRRAWHVAQRVHHCIGAVVMRAARSCKKDRSDAERTSAINVVHWVVAYHHGVMWSDLEPAQDLDERLRGRLAARRVLARVDRVIDQRREAKDLDLLFLNRGITVRQEAEPPAAATKRAESRGRIVRQ